MNQSLSEFTGTWELDPASLDYQCGRPGLRAVYTIRESADGLEFTLDADDAEGKPMLVTYGGKVDGRPYPIPGYPVLLILTQLPDGSLESIASKDGVAIDRWTRTLTPDRSAMWIVQHKSDTEGRPCTNSGLYRRISSL